MTSILESIAVAYAYSMSEEEGEPVVRTDAYFFALAKPYRDTDRLSLARIRCFLSGTKTLGACRFLVVEREIEQSYDFAC